MSTDPAAVSPVQLHMGCTLEAVAWENFITIVIIWYVHWGVVIRFPAGVHQQPQLPPLHQLSIEIRSFKKIPGQPTDCP